MRAILILSAGISVVGVVVSAVVDNVSLTPQLQLWFLPAWLAVSLFIVVNMYVKKRSSDAAIYSAASVGFVVIAGFLMCQLGYLDFGMCDIETKLIYFGVYLITMMIVVIISSVIGITKKDSLPIVRNKLISLKPSSKAHRPDNDNQV